MEQHKDAKECADSRLSPFDRRRRAFEKNSKTERSTQPSTVLMTATLLAVNPLLMSTLLSTPIVAFSAAALSANMTPLLKVDCIVDDPCR